MALSAHTIDIVKSTAPVLAEHGEQITALFYKDLFIAHPQLQHIFNMANQAKGEQKRALADAVFAYATHIDKLAALEPAVARIAHKHASLAVQPEHYPIVGEFLLKAIAKHLNLQANDPIILAWGEAYQALASIFISEEQSIYQNNQQKLGGWKGDRQFVIDKIIDEAQGVKSFYLLPKDRQPIATWQAGQYIGVKTSPNTSEYTEIRQYSLSNSPNNEYYRITVKAENEPVTGCVSNYLHQASVGAQLLLQPPTGEFVLVNDEPKLTLIAAGVGITPVLSMLLSRIDLGIDVSHITFIQCCKDESHQIQATTLKRLSQQHKFHYYVALEQGANGDHQGYLDEQILNKWLTDKSQHVYFCGPKAFMNAMFTSLTTIGFNPQNLHYETFGPSINLG